MNLMFDPWIPIVGLSGKRDNVAPFALADTEGAKSVEEALATFGIADAACVHRVGALEVGDLAVWVGVSAAHRDAACGAWRWLSAEVKSRRLELELEAKRAYLMLALNAAKRRVNQANRGLVKTITNAALARYSAGAGGHHEVARAQVELNAVDVEAIALSGERVSIVAMMNALRNLPADQSIPDPGEPATTVRLPATERLLELEHNIEEIERLGPEVVH